MRTGEWLITTLPELTPEEGRIFHRSGYGGAQRRRASTVEEFTHDLDLTKSVQLAAVDDFLSAASNEITLRTSVVPRVSLRRLARPSR